MAKGEKMSIEEARESIWRAIEGRVIYGTKVIIEGLLIAERAEWLQAQPYERGETRKKHVKDTEMENIQELL